MIDVDLEAATLVVHAGNDDAARACRSDGVASLAVDVDAVMEAVFRQRLPEVLGNRPDKLPEPAGIPRRRPGRSTAGRARARATWLRGDGEGNRGPRRQGCAVRRSGFDRHRQPYPGTEGESAGWYQDEHCVPFRPDIRARDHPATHRCRERSL